MKHIFPPITLIIAILSMPMWLQGTPLPEVCAHANQYLKIDRLAIGDFHYAVYLHEDEQSPTNSFSLLDKSYAEVLDWAPQATLAAGDGRYIPNCDLLIPDSIPLHPTHDIPGPYVKVTKIKRLLPRNTPQPPATYDDLCQYNGVVNKFHISRYLKNIPDSAFAFLKIKQSKIIIPASVDTVYTGAFMNCKLDTLVIEHSDSPLVFYDFFSADYISNHTSDSCLFAPRDQCVNPEGSPISHNNYNRLAYHGRGIGGLDISCGNYLTTFWNPEWPIKFFNATGVGAAEYVPEPCVQHLELCRNLSTVAFWVDEYQDNEVKPMALEVWDSKYITNAGSLGSSSPFGPFGVRSVTIAETVDSLQVGFFNDMAQILSERELVILPTEEPLDLPFYFSNFAEWFPKFPRIYPSEGTAAFSPYQFTKVSICRPITRSGLSKRLEYIKRPDAVSRREGPKYLFDHTNMRTLYYGILPNKKPDGTWDWDSIQNLSSNL